ncbi:hypothetical protein BUALT_Bualt01G0095200 [Buddleja alternifolia]|uniref:Crooked neck protein n=1 Tax=Buddleja alternifolia TaxID=168488 RepID=A0AAV6Y5T1_9LAMI|nr:hypothetical protein BUALT_Bualt01G0095200 [Buddleja alternifolia]
MRQAHERRESETHPPRQNITDATELADHRLRKRKQFEDSIRSGVGRNKISVYVKYAEWEESQNDFARARSVWERAVEMDYRDHTLWLKYGEFEMRNKFVDHARNVWERAVELLPRVDQLWCKYVHMEEGVLGNVAGTRRVFERWMRWMPDQRGWISYVEFELRYNEVERARAIFERLVDCHPKVGASWIRFAEFEMKNGEIERARNCYERGVGKWGDDDVLFLAFAEFEESCGEIERARCIYRYALDRVPRGRAGELYNKFVAFEKRYGDREGIEDGIVGTMRLQYEGEVRMSTLNYDAWFDYIQLEESFVNNKQRIEDVYERAIANVPPAQEKRYWQRYIYLWINYILYEELVLLDVDRTRDLYNLCLKMIPHEKFSFAKIWLMAAQFEVRQLNIDRARRILGSAIGMAPKDKIFKEYIEIELQLGNIERCRKLYEKYLEWSLEKCCAWIKFAKLERSLGETERVRAVFELAIDQPALDMPELLWKAYIDLEISESEYMRTRALYERLLNRTKHLNVWISYAKFEASTMEKEGLHEESDYERKRKCLERARVVFERALSYYTTPELKEERAMLLEEWLNMETSLVEVGDVDLVHVKLPKKLEKRTHIETENLKILEAAYEWKKRKIGSAHELQILDLSLTIN